MRLSHAFFWRGRARYWDVSDARRRPPTSNKRHVVHVRTEAYEAIKAIAARRGIAIMAALELVLDLP